ncbi:ATP-binding protein [Frankia sp. CNm7]|uniref:ATP-binding protein n=1 Tax=Frankia nepalensis TaxID=1836974 RepID=A0A937RN57_9ACTN|nr:ATP-binding protein [Frankia nepalensis]MBL7496256.1 ATP-binding protein [Frankia nepalensis]MBL7514922.1 ATP-binding protein [Frankia nepalensis]MBL7523371.1 ATP-binding protein [Frankia nepalensis]MBL7633142.1 ATP-binding protein [Frankia nepalensis]
MSTVELRFAALPGHVRTARRIAMAVARRAGVPAGALDEIRFAVGEACLRAVSVNRRRAPEDLVEVRMTTSDGVFTVTVTDSGEPSDDATPAADGGLLGAPALLDPGLGLGGSDLADAEPSDLSDGQDPAVAGFALPPGIGLALIEGLVDDVQIRRRPEGVGTVVTMSWDMKALVEGDLAAANPAR